MSIAIGMLLLLSPLIPLAFGEHRSPQTKPTDAQAFSALAFAVTVWPSGIGAAVLWVAPW